MENFIFFLKFMMVDFFETLELKMELQSIGKAYGASLKLRKLELYWSFETATSSSERRIVPTESQLEDLRQNLTGESTLLLKTSSDSPIVANHEYKGERVFKNIMSMGTFQTHVFFNSELSRQ